MLAISCNLQEIHPAYGGLSESRHTFRCGLQSYSLPQEVGDIAGDKIKGKR